MQRESTLTAPTPVLAFAPEINRDDPQANSGSGTLAHRQDDSARTIGPKARSVSNRSSVASRYVGAKRRLIGLWHQNFGEK